MLGRSSRKREPEDVVWGNVNVALKVVIRDVKESDLRHLTWFGTLNDFQKSIRANYKKHIEGRMAYLVADMQGFPVGQTVVAFERPADMPADDGATAYLYAVRVLAPLRSTGIGTALMEAARQSAIEHGCRHVRLTVQVANARALKLNERMGYKIVGQVKSGWSFTDSSGKAQLVNEAMFIMERPI
jgi:ribosomal protein S18 acetylase RimI-like enzyme